jgi:hypothetical protein
MSFLNENVVKSDQSFWRKNIHIMFFLLENALEKIPCVEAHLARITLVICVINTTYCVTHMTLTIVYVTLQEHILRICCGTCVKVEIFRCHRNTFATSISHCIRTDLSHSFNNNDTVLNFFISKYFAEACQRLYDVKQARLYFKII